MTSVSALILAGGKATRLAGIAKHELVVEGRTIFDRQVGVLAPRVAEILVSGPEIDGYRRVLDPIEGAGPLAGIAAGLAACTTEWLLVVAGDMPFLTGELIDSMLAARAVDAVGVRSANGLPEPLLCVLSRRVLPIVERALQEGRFKASRILTDEGLDVTWVDHADPQALRNVNSPEDLGRITGSK